MLAIAVTIGVFGPAGDDAHAIRDGLSTPPVPLEPFPVVAWYGVPEKHTSLERYHELADAGFTHSISAVSHADAVASQLEAGKAAGVKIIVCCEDLLGAKSEELVERFRDHPALGGYYVRDEPPAGTFAAVAEQVQRIQAVDERHPCYVNMFPNYATTGTAGHLGTDDYGEYVDRFVRDVPVPILSFDHYPVVVEPDRDGRASLRPAWHENLELVTAAGRRTGKPVWAFALSCPHTVYPMPTAAHLRVQAYTNLAYGIQAIQYFTYWTPPDTRNLDFHDAPITADGKRTAMYDRVKQMNREIQALRGVFLGATVVCVGHTGDDRPRSARAYRPTAPVKALKIGGHGAVVSLLSNAGRRLLVIVNQDIDGPTPVAIEFDGSAPAQRIDKDGSLRPVAGGRFESSIEPGDVCVLTWPGTPGQ